MQKYTTPDPDDSIFKVAAIGEGKCTLASYNRRDFYKITLILNCDSTMHYSNTKIAVKGPAIIFNHPQVPYSWEGDNSEFDSKGYFCVFAEDFIHNGNYMEGLQKSPLYNKVIDPVYFLNESQAAYLSTLFQKIREEIDSEYIYRLELIRSQLDLIVHETLKMQPVLVDHTEQKANSRVCKLFFNLLHKQFPIDLPTNAIKLKKAGNFADQLAVHVNHLNAAVQEVTGKPTTFHINERLVAEAKSLLNHTDWGVAEIAYVLGFEYQSYFNRFFKKHTGMAPLSFKKKSLKSIKLPLKHINH